MNLPKDPTMSTKGVHRSTPNSKRGRSMYNIGKPVQGLQTPEQIAWNKAVDEKKAAKALRKLEKSK